jgi:hypothetical protein
MSSTPAKKLSPVLLTPVNILSTTPAITFFHGVNDTVDKFVGGVNDTGD